jgi:hypothetical protein
MSILLPGRWFSRRVPAPKRAPVSRLALPTRADQVGLRFTEWLLLTAIGVAYLFCVSTPIFGAPLQISFLKHFPLMVLMPALALHLMGMLISRHQTGMAQVFTVCWPLVLLALFVVTGSLIGKQLHKVDDSFLTFGVYLLFWPLLAAVPALPGDPKRWVKGLSTLWIGAALVALIGAAARLPATQSLHEIEYLLSSSFVLMWLMAKSRWLKLFAVLSLVAAAGLNHKLTGYLVTILAFLFIALTAVWRRVDQQWRGFFVVVTSVLVTLFIVALAIAYLEFREFLPTGSPEVRMNQYGQAWRQFLASPVWGTAYTEGSGEEFREFNRLFSIPTHSDVLDILKHGGAIGFILFVLGYFKIFRVLLHAAAATRQTHILHAYFVAVCFFQMSALLTFSLNPLLLKGPFALVIWGNLALATGLALVLRRARESAR